MASYYGTIILLITLSLLLCCAPVYCRPFDDVFPGSLHQQLPTEVNNIRDNPDRLQSRPPGQPYWIAVLPDGTRWMVFPWWTFFNRQLPGNQVRGFVGSGGTRSAPTTAGMNPDITDSLAPSEMDASRLQRPSTRSMAVNNGVEPGRTESFSSDSSATEEDGSGASVESQSAEVESEAESVGGQNEENMATEQVFQGDMIASDAVGSDSGEAAENLLHGRRLPTESEAGDTGEGGDVFETDWGEGSSSATPATSDVRGVAETDWVTTQELMENYNDAASDAIERDAGEVSETAEQETREVLDTVEQDTGEVSGTTEQDAGEVLDTTESHQSAPEPDEAEVFAAVESDDAVESETSGGQEAGDTQETQQTVTMAGVGGVQSTQNDEPVDIITMNTESSSTVMGTEEAGENYVTSEAASVGNTGVAQTRQRLNVQPSSPRTLGGSFGHMGAGTRQQAMRGSRTGGFPALSGTSWIPVTSRTGTRFHNTSHGNMMTGFSSPRQPAVNQGVPSFGGRTQFGQFGPIQPNSGSVRRGHFPSRQMGQMLPSQVTQAGMVRGGSGRMPFSPMTRSFQRPTFGMANRAGMTRARLSARGRGHGNGWWYPTGAVGGVWQGLLDYARLGTSQSLERAAADRF